MPADWLADCWVMFCLAAIPVLEDIQGIVDMGDIPAMDMAMDMDTDLTVTDMEGFLLMRVITAAMEEDRLEGRVHSLGKRKI